MCKDCADKNKYNQIIFDRVILEALQLDESTPQMDHLLFVTFYTCYFIVLYVILVDMIICSGT